METEAIPAQKKGASFDVRESTFLSDREEAVAWYEATKSRLLQVSQWGEFAGEAPDTFVLADKTGAKLDRDAREGDLIKIHLPGPQEPYRRRRGLGGHRKNIRGKEPPAGRSVHCHDRQAGP